MEECQKSYVLPMADRPLADKGVPRAVITMHLHGEPPRSQQPPLNIMQYKSRCKSDFDSSLGVLQPLLSSRVALHDVLEYLNLTAKPCHVRLPQICTDSIMSWIGKSPSHAGTVERDA